MKKIATLALVGTLTVSSTSLFKADSRTGIQRQLVQGSHDGPGNPLCGPPLNICVDAAK